MTLTILSAIESNDIEQVKDIISNGIKFTKQNSPLGLAASLGNIEIVRVLVETGCKVEWGGELEPSPLCLAAYEGKTEVVKFLIEKQAKLDSKDEDGFTPLMIAAAMGHLEIVKLLVEVGAKINVESEQGDFALLSAATNGHHEIHEYLLPLTSPKLIRRLNSSLVDFGKQRLKAKPSKELIKLIDDIASVKIKMYHRQQSIESEMLQVHKSISKIVDCQAVDLNGRNALHHAIESPEIITALLKHGFRDAVNIQDVDGNTALILACENKNAIESIELLLSNGAETELKNHKGYTALMNTVISSKSNEIIRILYDAGANIEAQDEFENTALAIAYANSKSKYRSEGSQENVELLESLGASTNRFVTIDFINNAEDGNNDSVIEFIRSGGNINCKGIAGISALEVAVKSNRVDIVNILLNNGVTINNIADAFIYAVSREFTEIVKILINTGLDVNVPDCNGINAVTRAVETNNIMIVEYLLKAGAKVPEKDNINGDVVKLAKSVNLEIYKLLINKQT
jgi:uncharacterized protein